MRSSPEITRRPHRYAGGVALALLAAVSWSCHPTQPPRPAGVDHLPAHISFLSHPDGASVRVNGTLLEGTTPLEYQDVPAGLNVVEFDKPGYRPYRTQRYWNANAITRLDVTLEPLATPTPTAAPTATPTRALPPPPPPAADATRAKTKAPTPRPTRAAPPTAPGVAAVPQLTTVTLISTPPGATVIVNGQALDGAAPFDSVALPAGEAAVEFRLQNYESAAVERNWQAGGEDTLAIELVPLPARLSVHTTPSGATVKVNGVIVEGETPIDNALVPAGPTQVIIELESHVPFMKRETLAANGEMLIEAELNPLDTVVRFESDPPGATIIVNFKPLETKSPAGPMPMPPGHARVEFQLEGHAPKVIERDWAPNGLDSIMAKLTPNPGRAQFESSGKWDSLTVDGKAVAVRPGSWLPLMAGEHRALAQRSDVAAETEFVVPPGGDVVVTLNWANKRPSSIDYVELPAITATLGDARFADSNPIHAVDLAAFWIARREVTVDDYRVCVEAGRCPTPGDGDSCNWKAADRGTHPINCVSAEDAIAYAAWLAEKDGIPYRLPTGDEWERAARDNGDRIFPWGNEPAGARCNSCDQACGIERFRDESFNDGRPETAPVGALAYCASPEGVVDLIGNVAEWTRVGSDGSTFQARGGSWAQNGLFLEPALPVARPPSDRDPTIGFRLVVSSDALPNIPLPTATPVDTATPASAEATPTAESAEPVEPTPAAATAPEAGPLNGAP